MANWCENDLFVRGPDESVRKFLALAKGDQSFDFGRFVPYPERFRSLDEIAEKWDEDLRTNPKGDHGPRPVDGFRSGGKEWCVEHWGTKWPAYWVVVEEAKPWKDGLEVLVQFDTAWNPPLPVILKASSLFRSLNFELRYFERGCGFQGTFVVKNGDCLCHETKPYHGSRGG